MTLLQSLLLAALLCGLVYHLLSVWCAHAILCGAPEHLEPRTPEHLNTPTPEDLNTRTPEDPPVSILKPLRGADPGALASFATFCRQEYSEYQLVFGVLDTADPAVAVVQRLCEEFPAVPLALVVDARRLGANLKVSNLANMLPAARHELLLISDGDMRVTPDYLGRIAAAFHDPAVGLVTCPYRAVSLRGASAALESLGIATDFLPGVMVAARLGRADFAFGSTIALTRTVLKQIGGFEAIADYLADDFQLGHRVAGAGMRVALAPYVVESVLPNRGWRETLSRRQRWARTVRVCRPRGHAASVITQSAVFALGFLTATGFSPLGWAVLALQQGVRFATAWQIAVRGLENRELKRWFWLLPASDLLNFALWAGSWLGRHVFWRGGRFRLLPDGRLLPIDAD